MPAISILNKDGKKGESFDLPEKLFGSRINSSLIHQAVVMYQASQRQGNASTKERGSVSGGGRKPWRQKGTGRARAGSTRSPLWIGGGVVFGPHPREFGYSVPQKIRVGALRECVNSRFQSKDLICIADLDEKFKKTKEFAGILTALKLKGTTLALLDGSDESTLRTSRNIPHLEVKRADDVNAYDILRYQSLVVTKTALKKLLKRIQL